MSDAWHDQREEERSERRRARGYYRSDPPDTDIHQHEPTDRDRREVEQPLTRKEES